MHATLLVAGSGVRRTMMSWGDVMLRSAGTAISTDIGLEHLSRTYQQRFNPTRSCGDTPYLVPERIGC